MNVQIPYIYFSYLHVFITVYILVCGFAAQILPASESFIKASRNIGYIIIVLQGIFLAPSRSIERYCYYCTAIFGFISLLKSIPPQSVFLESISHLVLISSFTINKYHLTASYRRQYFRLFARTMLVISLIQIPLTIYQFSTLEIWDNMGGSLGDHGTGILCYLVYLCATFYLYRNRSRFLWYFIAIAIISPTLINETKITYILFVVMLASLMKFEISIRNIVMLILTFTFIFLAPKLLDLTYTKGNSAYDSSIYRDSDTYVNYFIGGEAYQKMGGEEQEGVDIPRLLKLAIILPYLHEKNALLLGLGVGSTRAPNTFIEESLAFGTKIFPVTALHNGGLLYFGLWIAVMYYTLFHNNRVNTKSKSLFFRFFVISTLLGLVYQNFFFAPAYAVFFGFFSAYLKSDLQ